MVHYRHKHPAHVLTTQSRLTVLDLLPGALRAPTPFWGGLKTYSLNTHLQLTHISDSKAVFLSHEYQDNVAHSIST